MMAEKREHLKVEGRHISLFNLDKVLYPAARFTKAQVIDYYIRISEFMLPHLKDRPVTLKRFPDGITGEAYYEKDAPGFTPSWVKTFPVPRHAGGRDIRYILVNDLPTLVWLANLAALELHAFLHRVPKLNQPNYIAFDLDPGEGADVLTCARVALMIRELLSSLHLESFVKVSGSKGLQMFVPLNTAVNYLQTQTFAKGVAALMARRHPDLIVADMAKRLRASKVFIDWSQNSDFKTTVSVYSLRAKSDRPFVSLPVTWEELKSALQAKDSERLYFTPQQSVERVKRTGDLFAPLLKMKQRLPKELVKALQSISTEEPESSANLETYRKKRDFAITPEPPPKVPRRSAQGGRKRFVIQKHAASHLHYDFRLEMGGVLKSWAVPKGPPYTKSEKRLAMATEDHPMDYLDFEGIIPKGQYGGGTVMVWDIGTYELIEGNYYKGHLKLYFEGKKLRGEWHMVRTKQADGRSWLLIKSGDNMRPLSAKRDDSSALTGRSMAQIAGAADAEWHSDRPARTTARSAKAALIAPRAAPQHTNEPHLESLPPATFEFVEPMMARLVGNLPEGGEWQYEIKLDGYRALCVKNTAGKVTLFSRRGNRLNEKFPLAAAFDQLPDGTIVDGEIVVLDAEGRPSFNALQNWHRSEQPIYFYAFDLLAYRGKDVRGLPLSDRRRLLEEFAVKGLSDPVRISQSFRTSAADLVAAARKQGLEGVIAKRATSVYESGARTGAWLKYKTHCSQELVIGGYTPGSHGFDALLVGYYKGEKLIFISKVRNGFDPALREQLARLFPPLETNDCPFANLPEKRGARPGEALTADVMKKCHWLKPTLVAQIEFAEWSTADHLRQALFAGLRDDKEPKEVIKEVAA